MRLALFKSGISSDLNGVSHELLLINTVIYCLGVPLLFTFSAKRPEQSG